MRRIDELLESVALKEEDYEMITEELLTESELDELKGMVLQVVREEKGEGEEKSVQKEVISLENAKRRKSKRWLLPLVATLTIGGSLIAGVTSKNLGGMFKVIFGENVSNIGESGLELGISDTQQGITLNVQGIVGDKQNAIILFDIEKAEDESFEGNSIKFGKLNFEVKKGWEFKGWNPFKVYSSTVSGSSYGWRSIDEAYQTPNQRIFQLEATLDEALIGKEAVLEITDIIEVQEGYWESEVDVVDFFKKHPEYLEQTSISMPQDLLTHTSEEELRFEGYQEKEIKRIMEDTPKRALPSRNLDLDLYPELKSNWMVDNIGFIGDQLHIRMYGIGSSAYTPSFKDALGNEVEMTYNITTTSSSMEGDDVSEGYYVYDIKDLEALSEVKLSSWFQKEIQKTQGQWQVPFTIDIKNQEKLIATNQEIPWYNDTYLTIKEMKLSNLSLQVTYVGEKIYGIPKMEIKFKDGKEQETFRQGSSHGENQIECTYTFGVPIDISEVESIKINEVEIQVE